MYDNDDEFGVEDFRDDVRYVYKMNSIIVNRYKRVQAEDNPATTGDYMGISSSTDKYSLVGEIEINVLSYNLRKKELISAGVDLAGQRALECITEYNVELFDEDIIEFKTSIFPKQIVTGERFVVKMDDVGALKGQFCFKKFKATSVGDVLNIDYKI